MPCHQEIRPAKKAVKVDSAGQKRNVTRLARIEGQVRGLRKMVEEERYCADILIQVSSVQQALRAVSRELMRNHLQHCATNAIRKGNQEGEQMYDEILDLAFKHLG